jgi:hypothetical protein
VLRGLSAGRRREFGAWSVGGGGSFCLLVGSHGYGKLKDLIMDKMHTLSPLSRTMQFA